MLSFPISVRRISAAAPASSMSPGARRGSLHHPPSSAKLKTLQRREVFPPRWVPLTLHNSGDVVQLVRTLPCHGRGREFESRRPRHFSIALCGRWLISPLSAFPVLCERPARGRQRVLR